MDNKFKEEDSVVIHSQISYQLVPELLLSLEEEVDISTTSVSTINDK